MKQKKTFSEVNVHIICKLGQLTKSKKGQSQNQLFFSKKTLRSISFESSPYMQLIIFLLSDCFQVAKMFWHQEFIPLKNQILPREPSWISNDNQNLTTIRFPIFLKIKMATGSHLEFEFKTWIDSRNGLRRSKSFEKHMLFKFLSWKSADLD